MQRWHDVACRRPEVRVSAGQTPHCHTCGKEPHVAELVKSRGSGSSGLSIPPDKPLGELDLWWPRTVPYVRSSPGSASNPEPTSPASDSTDRRLQDIEELPVDVGSAAEQTLEHSIYRSTLGSDEFRLIWLDAADSLDSPLHLNLHDHNLDDCPEYETVSYTWAGEDGDNMPCKPVYIGPFWDILLQTKNCWEMLRFVRPWYGSRVVWVDAICINQTDIQERNVQVANMSRIYSSCNRVIIYLGPDVAMPLYGKHARRRKLHEFADGSITPNFPSPQPADGSGRQSYVPPACNLNAILERRYFSRIWVIQELLLSHRAVMRIGDVDFWTDPATSANFSASVPDWSWEKTAAAWVQHISQGAESIRHLKDLLLLTSFSRATDPRDRLFGLLSIMPELSNSGSKDDGGIELQADYALTSQHVFIGLFSHCLLNMGYVSILYHASTNLSRWKSHYPTWAPDWTSREIWRTLFDGHKLTSAQVETEVRFIIEQGVHETEDPKSDWYIEPVPDGDVSFVECWGPASPHSATLRPWHRGAHIDASKGALNLNLTYLMPVPEKLRRVGRLDGIQVFTMKKPLVTVWILSPHRLDKMAQGDGRDELFIMSQDNHVTLLSYILLRRTPDAQGKESYNFVAACPFVLFQTRFTGNSGFRPLFLKDLQYSVYDILQDLQARLDYPLYVQKGLELPSNEMRGLFLGIETNRQILPLIQVLYEEMKTPPGDLDAFSNAYLACLPPEYMALQRGGLFQVTFSTKQGRVAEYYFKEGGWLNSPESRFKYRVRESGHEWRHAVVSPAKYKQLTDSSQPEQKVDVCYGTYEVRRALTNYSNVHGILATMDFVSASTGRTGESLWSMVTGDPGDDCKFICHPQGGQYVDIDTRLDTYLEMNGSTFMVSIE